MGITDDHHIDYDSQRMLRSYPSLDRLLDAAIAVVRRARTGARDADASA